MFLSFGNLFLTYYWQRSAVYIKARFKSKLGEETPNTGLLLLRKGFSGVAKRKTVPADLAKKEVEGQSRPLDGTRDVYERLLKDEAASWLWGELLWKHAGWD